MMADEHESFESLGDDNKRLSTVVLVAQNKIFIEDELSCVARRVWQGRLRNASRGCWSLECSHNLGAERIQELEFA